MAEYKCEMTISWGTFGKDSMWTSYGKCNKPAKFKNPETKMGVEFVCGIHARSLNKFYERNRSKLKCISLKDA